MEGKNKLVNIHNLFSMIVSDFFLNFLMQHLIESKQLFSGYINFVLLCGEINYVHVRLLVVLTVYYALNQTKYII